MKSKLVLRLSSAFLASMLLMSAFAGCAKTPQVSSQSEANASQQASSEEQPHTLSVLGYDRRDDAILLSNRDKYQVWKAFESELKKINITLELELIPTEQYATAITTRMAATQSLPDIVNLTDLDDQTVVGFGQNGTVVDLKSAMDQYSNGSIQTMWDKYWPSATKRITTADGKIYWFPSVSIGILDDVKRKGTGYILQIRKDWLDKVSLPIPTNVDELFTALKTFQDQDVNGNGQKDEICIFYLERYRNGIAQAFGLAPELVDIQNSTDKAVSPWYQEGMKDYILYMQKLLENGLIDASLFGASSDIKNGKISENKAALVYDYIGQSWLEGMITATDKAEYYATFPTSSDSIQPSFRRERSELVWQKFAVTKNCDDIAGAIKLFDFIYSDTNAELDFWGIKDLTFKIDENGNRVTLADGMTTKECEEKGLVNGDYLWGRQILPAVLVQEAHLKDWTTNPTIPMQRIEMNCQADAADDKMFTNDYYTTPALALPTSEEIETLNQYETTVKTYCEETLVSLIQGTKSLDDWDSYIKQMKELGLDKLIEVYQARHDRYLAS